MKKITKLKRKFESWKTGQQMDKEAKIMSELIYKHALTNNQSESITYQNIQIE